MHNPRLGQWPSDRKPSHRLKFNDEHARPYQQNGVNPSTHSWDIEFQKNATNQASDLRANRLYLNHPCIPLGWQQVEATILRELGQNLVVVSAQKI
jgi:hypothetical protein